MINAKLIVKYSYFYNFEPVLKYISLYNATNFCFSKVLKPRTTCLCSVDRCPGLQRMSGCMVKCTLFSLKYTLSSRWSPIPWKLTHVISCMTVAWVMTLTHWNYIRKWPKKSPLKWDQKLTLYRLKISIFFSINQFFFI